MAGSWLLSPSKQQDLRQERTACLSCAVVTSCEPKPLTLNLALLLSWSLQVPFTAGPPGHLSVRSLSALLWGGQPSPSCGPGCVPWNCGRTLPWDGVLSPPPSAALGPLSLTQGACALRASRAHQPLPPGLPFLLAPPPKVGRHPG